MPALQRQEQPLLKALLGQLNNKELKKKNNVSVGGDLPQSN